MGPNDSDVQDRITAFWSTIARYYESDPGNVPSLDTTEYAAWIRAIERLLPPPPADVLDVGTGTGFVALIASQLGHRAIGLDLSSSMLAEALFAVTSYGRCANRRLRSTIGVGSCGQADGLWSSMDSAPRRRSWREVPIYSSDTTRRGHETLCLRCAGRA